MRLYPLTALLTCCLVFAGCAPEIEIANPDLPWRTESLAIGNASFEYPTGLIRYEKSKSPLAYQLLGENDRFGILVVAGDEQIGGGYASDMIDSCIDSQSRVGEMRPIQIGAYSGVQQDHRSRDNFGYRVGTVIVLESDSNRLVFDISYLELFEDQLRPVYERVVGSLSCDEQVEPIEALAANAARP
ncbi:hypothetical protein [Stieleria marina]|uniref:Uncharacterized protein n=1 Tax=Stieleria marina TaxID=1930275 RepID=A0A517NRS3_9BACT|nr:hypothetical protein K239x_17810 [Planctomycetes bacterium K23_9]